MATNLKKLKINRVDLVDSGASFDKKTGEGAHVMLYKRATEKPAVSKVEHGAKDFDAMIGDQKMRKAAAEIMDCCYAMMDSMRSIVDDGEMEQAEKRGMMDGSLDQFHASVMEVMDDAMSDDVEKRGAKISKERLKRLTEMNKLLATILAEANLEEKTMEKAEVLKALEGTEHEAEVKEFIEGLEKRAAEAKPTDQPKPKTEEEVLKSLPPEVRQMVEKSQADAKKAKEDAEAATAIVKRMEDEQLLAEQIAVCKRWDKISVDMAVLPATLKALKAADQKGYEAVVKQMDAANAASAITKSVGADGRPDLLDDGSAVSEINKRVSAEISKDTKLTEAEAQRKVFRENPGLYAKYRSETSVKV